MRAHRDQHRIEALAAQIGNHKVASGGLIELERNVAGRKNFSHLRLDHVARQAIFRNAEVEHSASHGSGFENRDRVTHQSQIMGGGQSDRPAADNGHFEGQLVLRPSLH